jgi:dCMP deaminase
MSDHTNIRKWDKRFLRLAHEVSTWSKDPSKKIGAVASINNRIISTGYNGFPSLIHDNEAWLEDSITKRSLVIHAEMNLLMDAAKTSRSLDGATLYVWGLIICPDCMKHMIAAGIKRICYVNLYNDDFWNSEWNKSLSIVMKMKERIPIVEYNAKEVLE